MVWFVLLFPLTLYIRNYLELGVLGAIKEILLQFALGSTFRASWFLSSLIIGGLVVWMLSNYLNNRQILAIGTILYVLCCLTSNYYGFFQDDSIVHKLNELYPTALFNSFPASIIWIALGKSFVGKTQSKIKNEKMWLFLFLILLFAEKAVIKNLVVVENNDCYFMLLPVCWLLFDILRSIDLPKPQHEAEIKAFSTIAYCMHASVGFVLGAVLKLCSIDIKGIPGALFLYMLTVIFVVIFTKLVVCLEQKGWKWLSYLH